MKKLSIFMSMACALLGLASCSQDRDPVLQQPTEFVLNAPAMEDQYIALAEGNTLELICSQPDYGYSAVANYSAEMSLTEDFAESRVLEPTDNHQTRMTINQLDVATGICELSGVTDEETFAEKFPNGMEPMKVYFRAVCELDGVEGSRIVSNVVSYNQLKGYFAVPVPGFIYLVGAPEGWAGPTESNAAHYADWRLYEPKNAIGSKIYTGTFQIGAGADAMFRFYTKLSGWDADSYGSQADDNPVEFPDFTSGSFTAPVVKGKGSFSFPNWPGGEMTITVDMSDEKNITVTCSAGNVAPVITKYIYLIGSMSGWVAPGTSNADALKDFRLADSDDSGIYVGKFNVAAGHINFRFALELTDADWDNPNQIGIAENDGDVECSFTNNSFNGPYVSGKGNWAFDLDKDAVISMTVDTNNKTVTYVIE